MWDSKNIFLNGPYAPGQEEGKAFDLEIEGQLPRELNGALYRVGSSQHYRPANEAFAANANGEVVKPILRIANT